MITDRKDAATARAKRCGIGALALHIDGFAAFLFGAGYTSTTVHEKSDLLADLSHWLERHGLPLDALDEGQFTRFHADRRRRGKERRIEATTGRQLLRAWHPPVALERPLDVCQTISPDRPARCGRLARTASA